MSTDLMTKTRSIVALLIGFGVVVLIYFPGLWGGFFLDDHGNLRVLGRWLQGNALWQEVVFGNDSGPLGRSLAMATFLANAALSGLAPFGYKVFNLAIHVACMGLAAGFLRELLRGDPNLRNHAVLAALAIAFWWAILPIHAATVLYVIQRMAQLSTLFIFGGLWLFVYARNRIELGSRNGTWLLWLGIPALTTLGAFAKENALLLPLLCGAVELGYFSDKPRPRGVRWFFLLGVLLPAVAFVGVLLFSPESILRGYERREFGPMERLLTQPRILWTYVSSILVPFGPRLGIFQDNYLLSTGLFRPMSTAVAIAAWITSLTVAWLLRRAAPAVLTGVLLFLLGHAMESSIFPLEMIFLHRNYMPALGLLLALAGLGTYLLQRLPAPSTVYRLAGPILLALFVLVLCGSTYGRALVWQSEEALYAQELETNPHSVRTRTAVATYALRRGYPSAALAQIEELESFAPPEHQGTIILWKILIVHCQTESDFAPELVQVMKENPPDRIHPYAAHAMGLVTNRLEIDQCGTLAPGNLADASLVWLDNVTQPDSTKSVVGFRYNAARQLAKAGRQEEALHEALRAWRDDGKRQFPIGAFVFHLAASLEKYETCEAVLSDLERWSGSHDLRKRRTLESFRRSLEDAY